MLSLSVAKNTARVFRDLLMSPIKIVDGVVIPANRYRFGGKHFQSDRAFLESGKAEALKLMEHCGLSTESALLEIGCGPGRLPVGIIATLGDIALYEGIDVSETPIRWCQKHIASTHPSFGFRHIDVYNARYNKNGSSSQEKTTLPFADSSFDCAYHYSVFSHLLEDDIRAYLAELHRVLKSGGAMLFTAFVEDDVPNVEENPEGYIGEWKGALHCVRYERSFFEKMLGEYGFAVKHFVHGKETDGQSMYVLTLNK